MSDFFLSFHRISPIFSANHLYACFLRQYIRRACKVSFFCCFDNVLGEKKISLAFSPWSKIVCYYIDCLLYFYTVVFLLIDQSQRGSLFTLFLYNPLMGFLSVCGLSSMRYGLWEKAQELLRKFFHDIGQMITSSRVIGNANMCRYPWYFFFFFMLSFIFIHQWQVGPMDRYCIYFILFLLSVFQIRPICNFMAMSFCVCSWFVSCSAAPRSDYTSSFGWDWIELILYMLL